jgi:hypothetical protein
MQDGPVHAQSHSPAAHDNYRVVLKLDEGEFEIGSIGIQHGPRGLGKIDTSTPTPRRKPGGTKRIVR